VRIPPVFYRFQNVSVVSIGVWNGRRLVGILLLLCVERAIRRIYNARNTKEISRRNFIVNERLKIIKKNSTFRARSLLRATTNTKRIAYCRHNTYCTCLTRLSATTTN